jgi:hypothetical protein
MPLEAILNTHFQRANLNKALFKEIFIKQTNVLISSVIFDCQKLELNTLDLI